MLLAKTQHLAAPRGQTKARSGREARDVLHGQVPGAPLPQKGRPAPLPEVAGWQERIQRHPGEHDLPYVQILDDHVPQMVDNALEFFRRLDLPVAEQVIEVPNFSSPLCPSRAFLIEPQKVEQLMEVPTVLSPALFQQQTVEQLVDIPVPRRRRGQGGLLGSPSGQSSATVAVQKNIDIPVPGRGGAGGFGGLQGFPIKQRSSQRTAEQLVDIPVPGGGLHVPLPDPGASASSAVSRDERGEGGFRTFHQIKKSATGPVQGLVSGEHHDYGRLHGAEEEEKVVVHVPDSIVWVHFRDAATGKPYYWHRRTRVSTYELPPLPPE